MEKTNRAYQIAAGLAAGAVAGVIAGLLLAPRSGKQTREIIRERMGALRQRIRKHSSAEGSQELKETMVGTPR